MARGGAAPAGGAPGGVAPCRGVFLGCAIPRGCRAEGQVGCDPPLQVLSLLRVRRHCCRRIAPTSADPIGESLRPQIHPGHPPGGVHKEPGSSGELFPAREGRVHGDGRGYLPHGGGPTAAFPREPIPEPPPALPASLPCLITRRMGNVLARPPNPRLAPVATAEPWGSSGAPGPFAIAASPRRGQPLCVCVPPPRPEHLETFL